MSDKRMTYEYQRDVSDFVRNNVLCCVSSLVSDVAKLVSGADRDTLRETSFEDAELMDLCQRRDYETPAREKIGEMDRDDLISALVDVDVEDERSPDDLAAAIPAGRQLAADEWNQRRPSQPLTAEDFDGDDLEWPGVPVDLLRGYLLDTVDGLADGWKDFCDRENLDCEYDDVYEHWAVDPWFGARLKERGEVVGDFGNLTVWGRCTTGQSISMDYVVCQIYDELHAK